MDTPNQIPTLNFKKLGLLAMAPIALVIHGLVLWIPVNTETKKEKEPEKKEELQAIGDMPLPIAAPIASPSPKTANSTPATNPSAAASSPVVIQKVIEKVIETKSQPTPQPKPSESPKPTTTPISPVTPPVIPEVTPEGTIQASLTGVPCPGELRCTEVSAPQGKVLEILEKQYGSQHQEINDSAPPNKQGDRPAESQIKGYRIKDNRTNKFLYFILPPVAGNKVRFLVQNEQQIIAQGGIL